MKKLLLAGILVAVASTSFSTEYHPTPVAEGLNEIDVGISAFVTIKRPLKFYWKGANRGVLRFGTIGPDDLKVLEPEKEALGILASDPYCDIKVDFPTEVLFQGHKIKVLPTVKVDGKYVSPGDVIPMPNTSDHAGYALTPVKVGGTVISRADAESGHYGREFYINFKYN